MVSKAHFYTTVLVRWIKLLFQFDKNISLKRIRSADGQIVCRWKNALWIELPSGQHNLSISWVPESLEYRTVAAHVTVQGFSRKQIYSLTALLLNESMTIQPFSFEFDMPEITFAKQQKNFNARPIKVSGRIPFVNSKSIEIKHNTFSKITLP